MLISNRSVIFCIVYLIVIANPFYVKAQKIFNTNIDTNYFDICEKYLNSTSLISDSLDESSSFTKFKRWQSFWVDRIGPSGSFNYVNQCLQQNIANSIININTTHAPSIVDNWEPIGPFGNVNDNNSINQNTSGNGQINRLFIDPSSLNVLYAYSYWRFQTN